MYIFIILAVIFLTLLVLSQNKPSDTLIPLTPTPALSQEEEASQENGLKQYPNSPEILIDKNKSYQAILKTTEGDITLNLFAKETPITVNNFVFLAREQFYDGTIFHRVIKDFMIQGGDPLGNGTGGPGYQFEDEPISKDYTRGMAAMANSGPNTNGSQFFIMHQDRTDLPKDYVIFGQVLSGMDVVDKIATAKTQVGGDGAMSAPIDPVTIQSVEIIED